MLLPTPPCSCIRAVRVNDEVLVVLEITADAEALIVLGVGGDLGADIVNEVAYDRVCSLVTVIVLAAFFVAICRYIKA